MRNKKLIWLPGMLCVVLNAVSIYFFINRNSFGQYTHLASYSELYAPANNTPGDLKKWQLMRDQYPDDQLKEGKRLTATLAQVKEQDSTLTKLVKIGSWLRRSFSKCEIGKPSVSFDKLSNIDQYKTASRAESPIWCGTYASQLSFFCNANGITCRYIESKGGTDNHVVNETFVPELGQWVFSDLLNNVICATDNNNKIINTVDVLYRNSKNDTTSFTAYRQTGNDSLQLFRGKEYGRLWNNYFNTGNKLYFHYTTDLDYVYNSTQKTIRYIYPKTWFELFTLTPVSNTAFYIRTLFLYAGIISLLIFIPFYLKKK